MMMEHTYKQFVESVTKWNKDLLLLVRIKLTLAYLAVSALILAGFSSLLYEQTLVSLREAINDQIFEPQIRQVVFDQATHAIQSRLLFVDGAILLCVLVSGYFLTAITLRPIKEARKREQRFLADAAHELRMPLSVMKTGVEVELRGAHDMPQRTKKLLTENIAEIDTLISIANGLLSLVSEKNVGIKPNSIQPLDTMVSSAIKKIEPFASAKQIPVTMKTDDLSRTWLVSVDQNSLSRAFENLLENAIKYTPSGGEVNVSLEHKKSSIVVKIQDTGIGISQSDLPHISEPFFRADSARTASEGTGLGLSIVNETIHAHGGKLEIASTLGVGTLVTVTLPEIAGTQSGALS